MLVSHFDIFLYRYFDDVCVLIRALLLKVDLVSRRFRALFRQLV